MRFALGIEYNGSCFFGWQAQENVQTIQSCVNRALSKVADEPIQTYCAGRTDAGVHALGQVIHFDTETFRPLRAWVVGTNTYLPSSISICWAQEVNTEFHARFSAIARRYRYVIFNQSLRSALLDSRVSLYHKPLNVKAMQLAGQFLIGEHDFNSFRSSQCESKTSMRNVQELVVSRQDAFVQIEIQANAFLHHMVRNIVGVLLRIGSGEKEPEWMESVLLAKNRCHAAETASANGLYLTKVIYPAPFHFPEPRNSFLLL